MKIGNEIRVKIEDVISDDVAVAMVSKVIERGKISDDGKKYCWVTGFNNGCNVILVNYRKTALFYVTKEKNNKNK